MTFPVLGVDPGSGTGGAALAPPDGSTVRAWLTWTWLKGCGGRFRLRGAGLDFPESVPTLYDAGLVLAGLGPYRLVLEGLFLAHGRTKAAKGKRRSLLPLAESAGEVLGPLRSVAVGEVLRPKAQDEWRRSVLGLPRDTNDKAAEEYAVSWARRNLVWAAELPRARALLTDAEEGAVCEAACMAVWGGRQGVGS